MIDRDGSRICFAGHSEAGKSTSARLWHHEGATVLSDDRVVLRLREDRVWMYWHPVAPSRRSSGAPRRRPCRGSFFLAHGRENSVRPAAAPAPPRDSSHCCFPPFHDQRAWTHARSAGPHRRSRAVLELAFVPDPAVVSFVRRRHDFDPDGVRLRADHGACASDPRFMRVLETPVERRASRAVCAPGWSMYPTIRDGDAITVVPLGQAPVRVATSSSIGGGLRRSLTA